MPPYAKPQSKDYQLTIFSDLTDKTEVLQNSLHNAGFNKVDVRTLTAKDRNKGFRVVWKESAIPTEIARSIKHSITEGMEAVGADKSFSLKVSKRTKGDDNAVSIFFPVDGVDDGSLEEAIASPSNYHLKIYSFEPNAWAEIVGILRGLGFKRFEVFKSASNDPVIKYGGAPGSLVGRIQEILKENEGVDVPTNKSWSDNDNNIWLYLPKSAPLLTRLSHNARKNDLSHRGTTQPVKHNKTSLMSFIETTEDTVRVGDLTLEKNLGPPHPLAPSESSFAEYCIDELTAETLYHIALSVKLNEPCLLEGETGTSKTSCIRYLAAILNQPVLRFNFSGQTDTYELIGQFVPSEGTGEEPDLPRGEGLDLRWKDGALTISMKYGYWFLGDEANVAESQVIERINSALEREPSLVLTEYDHSVIGDGGHVVHPRFRLFSTMNPAEAYAGRSSLSPAFRDRWTGYRFIPKPNENCYYAMLRFLVYGKQPDLMLNEKHYLGGSVEPEFKQLVDYPGIDSILKLLARLHSSLENAASSSPSLGFGSRKEEYLVTRRSLMAVLDYLKEIGTASTGKSTFEIFQKAVDRYYLGRTRKPDEKELVLQIMEAVGVISLENGKSQ